MRVTLEDIYQGNSKLYKISRNRICKSCKGSGARDSTLTSTCNGCNGAGVKVLLRQINMTLLQQKVICPDCNGQGMVVGDHNKCPDCKGTKVVSEDKELKIDIDKGAPDGKRYSFSQEGDEAPGIDSGDVHVELFVDVHPRFIRKGADLITTIELSLIESLTHFEIELEHLDGRKVYIINTGIIKPGELMTVKDLGLPFFESPYKFGNLYVNFGIKFPTKVEDEVAEELKNVKIYYNCSCSRLKVKKTKVCLIK